MKETLTRKILSETSSMFISPSECFIFVFFFQSLDSQNQHSVEREMAIADLKRGLSHRLHGLDSETQTVDQVIRHRRTLDGVGVYNKDRIV